MLQFLIRRFAIMIPMMVLMSIVAFGIIQAPPGDYLQTYIAELSATGDYVDARGGRDPQESIWSG